MRSRRYTVVIADRSTGAMRHVTVNVRATILVVAGVLALPVLMGLGARWGARQEIDQLRGANSMLLVENGSYRAATGELTTQIQSLEGVINDLGARAALDPNQARAMAKLPAIVTVAGHRRQQRRQRRRLRNRCGRVRYPRRHVRRPAQPSSGPRKPSALRPEGCRAARGAGLGDAVDLAGARLADRDLRRTQRSVYR